MPAPIFKNRSYVFSLGVDAGAVERLTKVGVRFGFRLIPMQDVAECQVGAGKTDQLVCIIVGSAADKTALEQATAEKKTKVLHVGDGGDLSLAAELEGKFLQMMADAVSPNFKSLVLLNIDETFLSLSGGSNYKFQEGYQFETAPEGMIYCDLVDESLFVRAQIDFSYGQLKGIFGGANGDEAKVVDFLKEVTNQSLGMVSKNLKTIGMDCRGSLPNFVDLRNSEPPKFSNFFTSIQASSPNAPGMSIRLGYMDIQNNPLPNFEAIEVGVDDSEIEFL